MLTVRRQGTTARRTTRQQHSGAASTARHKKPLAPGHKTTHIGEIQVPGLSAATDAPMLRFAALVRQCTVSRAAAGAQLQAKLVLLLSKIRIRSP
ncbi:hypothetical protein cyc_04493 [Cyclospora cayetanensis]|uniref:Uncharacterized protein n=1 Tax=Cyclospora cayetanensis TaxID=88456 RepID=A0A1D3D2Q5_9EIME|nr:hypothetical protein cyc_04493 [Cyclospora cayetanensis]